MAYDNKYTVSSMLNKISLCIAMNEASVPFPYKLFKRIMMDNELIAPVITYERTLKQKYQDLVDLGYISESETPRLNVIRVQEKLSEMVAHGN